MEYYKIVDPYGSIHPAKSKEHLYTTKQAQKHLHYPVRTMEKISWLKYIFLKIWY